MKSWMYGACVMALMLGHMEYVYRQEQQELKRRIAQEVEKLALNGLTEEENRTVAAAYWKWQYEIDPGQFR